MLANESQPIVPSIQILSRDVDLGKKIKLRGKNQYDVFHSKSINYILKNIKAEKVDITIINLIDHQLRDTFYTFTEKNSHKNLLFQTILFFISPIELSENERYLFCIHKYPYQDQFWWSHSGNQKTFLASLDFFLKKNINHIRTYRENLLLKAEKKNFLSLQKDILTPKKHYLLMSGNQKPPYSFLLGESERIKECQSHIQFACKKHTTMLLVGEPGLEQKDIAHYIHVHSSRREAPFTYINLHGINNKMHFQKLFGHLQNEEITSGMPISITDQTSGTLFLEGIESLPWDIQIYFLKAIHDRDILNQKKDKLKLILSTNKDMNFLLDSGLFRQDLISKIKINMIQLPNLRERKPDLIYLIDQYLIWYEKKYKKPIHFASDLKLALAGYHWPENLHSLYDFLGQLVTVSSGDTCELDTLKLMKQAGSSADFMREESISMTPNLFSETTLRGFFQPELENVEKLYVEQILKSKNGNVAKAARTLGISRKTLYAKLKIYNLKAG